MVRPGAVVRCRLGFRGPWGWLVSVLWRAGHGLILARLRPWAAGCKGESVVVVGTAELLEPHRDSQGFDGQFAVGCLKLAQLGSNRGPGDGIPGADAARARGDPQSLFVRRRRRAGRQRPARGQPADEDLTTEGIDGVPLAEYTDAGQSPVQLDVAQAHPMQIRQTAAGAHCQGDDSHRAFPSGGPHADRLVAGKQAQRAVSFDEGQTLGGVGSGAPQREGGAAEAGEGIDGAGASRHGVRCG